MSFEISTGGALPSAPTTGDKLLVARSVSGTWAPFSLDFSTLSGLYAGLSSPAFTNVPTAPTATSGTSTTQLATTAFVMTAVGAAGGGTITGVTAGTGLAGGGTTGSVTVSVSFGGSGAASTVAHSDHTHTAYAAVASNLADLSNVGTARNNLGLGNIALLSGTSSGQIPLYNGSAWSVFTIGSGLTLSSGVLIATGGGSSGYGAPALITASGAQTVTLGNPRTFVEISNTSGATAFTLPNGTVDGQLALIVVQPTTQAHTIAGIFFGTGETYAANSPNNGFSMHCMWSTSQTSWYPFSFDGGYKVGDMTAASSVTGTDALIVNQSGTDKSATALQVSSYSLGRMTGDATVNTSTGVATVQHVTVQGATVSDSSGTATCSLANNQRVFDIALTSTARSVAISGSPTDRDVIVLRFTGTGTVTTWPTGFKWPSGTAPSFSSGSWDVSAMWHAGTSAWRAVASPAAFS